MTRILYIITDFDFGGTEKQLVDLVLRLDRNEYLPVICSLKTIGHAAAFLNGHRIPVYCCGMPAAISANPVQFLRSLITLSRLIKEFQPNLIHTFLFRANVLGRCLGQWHCPQTPVISTIGVWDERRLPLALESWTSAWARYFLTNSQWVAQHLRRRLELPPETIKVIYNGIDGTDYQAARRERQKARQHWGLAPEHFLFVSVGRLDEQKGFSYLLEAFHKLQPADNKIRLIIAGHGPQKTALEKQIKSLGLENTVKPAGFIDNVAELLAAADCFTLASLWEGSPNAILEAMTAGLPIVATRVCGTPELIEHEKEGFLVESGNSVALSQAMRRILSHPDKAAALANAAQRKATSFSPNIRAQQIQELYKNSISS